MRRPAIFESSLGRKWLLAIAVSLAAVIGLVLVEGVVLRWLGLIATQSPRSSVIHFSIADGQGLSVFWSRGKYFESGRRSSLAVHQLPLGQRCEAFHWEHVAVQAAIWIPPHRQAVIASEAGTIYTWDASNPGATPQPLGEHRGSALALGATSDGRWLVAASDIQLTMWDLQTRQLGWRRDDRRGYCLAIHPVSENVILGDAHGEVLELDLHSGDIVRTLARHNGTPDSVAVSPDGQRVASVGGDRRLVITDFNTAETIWSSPHVTLAKLCFSPGGETLVSSGFDDDAWSLLVWDASDGRQRAKLTGHKNVILGIAFASNGTLYSWSTDGTLREWDLKQGRQTNSFTPATKEAC